MSLDLTLLPLDGDSSTRPYAHTMLPLDRSGVAQDLKLLALWEGIKARGFDVNALTPAEASELYDALADEGT